uniref:Uncharacterized protein n=1 Tax=Trichobilharzia regenti TaxID=157069 RepID=A0AA85JJ34_TRIRE|nr:unnamed protein product [Trichobilharzia regenti]
MIQTGTFSDGTDDRGVASSGFYLVTYIAILYFWLVKTTCEWCKNLAPYQVVSSILIVITFSEWMFSLRKKNNIYLTITTLGIMNILTTVSVAPVAIYYSGVLIMSVMTITPFLCALIALVTYNVKITPLMYNKIIGIFTALIMVSWAKGLLTFISSGHTQIQGSLAVGFSLSIILAIFVIMSWMFGITKRTMAIGEYKDASIVIYILNELLFLSLINI